MKVSLVTLVLVFVVLVTAGLEARAGTWTDNIQEPSCVPFVSAEVGACVDVLGYSEGTPIYVQGDLTWNYLASRATSMTNAASIDTVETKECIQAAIYAACVTTFRPCLVLEEEPVPWPIQPCLSVCSSYMETCGRILQNGLPIGIALILPEPQMGYNLTCSERDVWTNYTSFWKEPSYNVSAAYFTEGADEHSSITLECSDPRGGNAVFACQLPLVTSDDGRCGFECPLPTLTEEQYGAVKTVQAVLAWCSLVATCVMIITTSLHKHQRQFPANLVIMVAISANIAAGALCLAHMIGEEEVWCDDAVITFESEFNRHLVTLDNAAELYVKTSLCTFQGFLLMFGILAATFWWLLIAVNMLFQLMWRDYIPERWKDNLDLKLQLVFHVLAWGLAALFALIPAATDSIAFTSADTFCFVSSYAGGEAMFWSFWVVPVSVCLSIGTLCFLVCIIKISFISFQTGRLELLLNNLRVVMFVVVFLLVYCFLFAYSIKVQSSKEEVEKAYDRYFACMMFPWIFGKEGSGDCKLDEDVTSYPLVVLRAIGVSALGLLLFCTFANREWLKVYQQTLSSSTSKLKRSSEKPPISSKKRTKKSKRSSSSNSKKMPTAV
ncbi:Wnt-activated receptor [Balamuthia mandrillaris]